MDNRNHKTQIENVVGRFWLDREDPEVSMGYIDLGVFGRIKNVKLFRSRKRQGKENIDSDYTIVVRAVDTPIGLMRFCKEMIEKALWEEDDGREGPTVGEGPRSVATAGKPHPVISVPATAPGPLGIADRGDSVGAGDEDLDEIP